MKSIAVSVSPCPPLPILEGHVPTLSIWLQCLWSGIYNCVVCCCSRRCIMELIVMTFLHTLVDATTTQPLKLFNISMATSRWYLALFMMLLVTGICINVFLWCSILALSFKTINLS